MQRAKKLCSKQKSYAVSEEKICRKRRKNHAAKAGIKLCSECRKKLCIEQRQKICSEQKSYAERKEKICME